jgi:hypothetical protein
MMLNDQIGLCTCAGAAHLIQLWTATRHGVEVTITDEDVLAAYKAITLKANGREYDPADPSTDTGLALLDVLKYWMSVGIGEHKIGAFAQLNHLDLDEIRAAGHAFGGLYTGLALPVSAMQQVGDLWTMVPGPSGAPGSEGGHCAPITAASSSGNGSLKYATWGRADQQSDGQWAAECVDEAYAIFTTDWVDGTAPAPSGLDVNALRAYLATL